MGKPNCSNHSFGTGGCTSVVLSVAGRPLGPIKCFSGAKSPERPPNVHCAGCSNFFAAASSSTALAGGLAGLGGGVVCCAAKCSRNFIALREIDNVLKEDSSVAAITSTRT